MMKQIVFPVVLTVVCSLPVSAEWYDGYDFASKSTVGFWPFDGDTNDYSGNGNHGQFEDSGGFLVSSPNSRFGSGAAEFSPQTFGMSIETRDLGQEHTITFWAYRLQSSPPGTIAAMYQHNGHLHLKAINVLSVTDGGSLEVSDNDPPGTSSASHVYSNGSIGLGSWYHVACVWTTTEKRVYVNGVLDTVAPWGGQTDWLAALQCGDRTDRLGGACLASDKGLAGRLDDVAIFNRALTATEVDTLSSDDNDNGVADFWEDEIQVSIDIKPGSDPNSINLGSLGVFPVAILSTETFDATEVNPDTVSLAGARVKLVGKSSKYVAHEEDANGDGWLDLVCQVYTAQFMIEPGETVAVLEAETYDGTQIRGEDSVKIVP